MPHMAQLGDFMHYQVHTTIPAVAVQHAHLSGRLVCGSSRWRVPPGGLGCRWRGLERVR